MLASSPHTHVLLLLRKALFAVRQRLPFAYFICEAMRRVARALQYPLS